MSTNAKRRLASPPNGEPLPPYDTEAEAGALACILTAGIGEAPRLLEQLRVEDFYDERHREILPALQCLRRDGRELNAVELDQWLRDKRRRENAGGKEYVAGLPDATPSPAAWPSWFETVRDRAERRALLRDLGELQSLTRDLATDRPARADAARRMGEAHGGSRRGSLPESIDAAGFLEEPLQPPPELIAGILHGGSKLVLGGGSKSFKTWCLLDMALSVSHGQPWLSFDTVQGRVLYCNFEIQPWSLQKRISAVANAKGIAVEPGRLAILNLRGMAANFETLLPQIRERAKQDFALIVLDPIYKLYGHIDENKAGDVARLLNGLEELALKTTAATAFGAHFSKGNQSGKESLDRISGSGVFARDPDSLLVFTKHKEENAFSVEATLRNFSPIELFAVRWEFPLMRVDTTLDPTKLKQPGGRKPEHDAGELLAVLADGGLENKDWIAAARDEQGINERAFYRLRKRLEADGRVTKSKVSSKWITLEK